MDWSNYDFILLTLALLFLVESWTERLTGTGLIGHTEDLIERLNRRLK